MLHDIYVDVAMLYDGMVIMHLNYFKIRFNVMKTL